MCPGNSPSTHAPARTPRAALDVLCAAGDWRPPALGNNSIVPPPLAHCGAQTEWRPLDFATDIPGHASYMEITRHHS